MQFDLSDEQKLFREQAEKAFSRIGGLAPVRTQALTPGRFAGDVWAALCDLGLPGLLVPEAYGGLALGLLDAALLSELLGRHLVLSPFLGPVVAAPLAIVAAGTPAQRAALLPRIASGELRIAVAIAEPISGVRVRTCVRAQGGTLDGKVYFAVDIEGADMILVVSELGGLHLVEAGAPGLSVTMLKTIDITRSVAALEFRAAPAAMLPDATPTVLARLGDALRLCVAADLLGAGAHMLAAAVEYAKVRVQFGRPIGSFQAVQHLCAEAAAELEPGRALLWYAGHALQTGLPDARLTVLHAKSYMAEAGRLAARNATEVHGGMGITDALGLHYWFKRVGWGYQAFGGPERLREEAAALQGLVA